jgi:alanine-synthesizing transaminase
MQNDFLTEKLPPYIFAAIYQLKKQAALNNIDVIDFGMGNPDSPPPQHIIDKLSDLVKDKKLYGYSVTGGIKANP